MSATFYRDLEPFGAFNDLVEDRHYARVPGDWTVFVADIAGSTKAIEEGRYKDVNTLGASCIIAAQNALAREPFPYVFGGDGATLLVPTSKAAAVGAALAGVRDIAKKHFDMTLRVGAVPVAELDALGARIEVARFRLVGAQTIALFRGGGVSRAESLVKDGGGAHLLSESHAGEADLGGLSCRWQPIPSRNGVMLALLVTARTEGHAGVYRGVLADIDAALGGDSAKANPIDLERATYKSFGQMLKEERGLQDSVFSKAFFTRFYTIVASQLLFRLGLPIPGVKVDAYVAAVPAHADFRKFDDALRMVVDCSRAQADAIRAALEARRQKGELWYGLHESAHALMTCFVYGLDDGEHVHFVDGGGGGYALAAKQYKAQKKS